MILLDTALPPSAPWWAAVILAAGSGLGTIIVAWFQYRAKKADAPDIKPLAERVAAAEEKIAAVVGTDRADVAQLKEDVGAIGVDLGRLRDAVERRWTADDKRRGRAGELAQADREKLHEAIAGLREKVATMTGTLQGMMERGSNGNR